MLLGTKISAGDTESNKTQPLLSKIIVSSGKGRQVNHDSKNNVQRAMAGQRRGIRQEAKRARKVFTEKGSLIRIWKNEWEGATGDGVKGRGNGVFQGGEGSLVTASSTKRPVASMEIKGQGVGVKLERQRGPALSSKCQTPLGAQGPGRRSQTHSLVGRAFLS